VTSSETVALLGKQRSSLSRSRTQAAISHQPTSPLSSRESKRPTLTRRTHPITDRRRPSPSARPHTLAQKHARVRALAHAFNAAKASVAPMRTVRRLGAPRPLARQGLPVSRLCAYGAPTECHDFGRGGRALPFLRFTTHVDIRRGPRGFGALTEACYGTEGREFESLRARHKAPLRRGFYEGRSAGRRNCVER
jgi:hypothetical protein